jgi:hypothetical protein
MDIAIIGTGNVGMALGRRLSKAGHRIIFGSRRNDPETQEKVQSMRGASLAGVLSAAAQGEAVILAVPWSAINDTLASVGNLAGKVVLDCTNPLKPDLSALTLGTHTSGAEFVAKKIPGAKLVKIFNSTGVANMIRPTYGMTKVTMFYCGDDVSGKEVAAKIASDVGFDPVDAGPLISARFLEPLALLWIHLSRQQSLGSDFVLQLIHRPKLTREY